MLCSFPPEVLGLITSFMKTKHVLRRHLTGDSPLRRRLNAGGVTKLAFWSRVEFLQASQATLFTVQPRLVLWIDFFERHSLH